MKRKFIIPCIILSVLSVGQLFSQNSSYEMDVKELSSNLYRFSCRVNNWLVLAGPDGVLLSDSAPRKYAEAMKAELKKLGHDEVKYIINTHWHHDHCGGNLFFGKNAVIIAQHSVRKDLAMDKYISLFDEQFKAYPEYALPNMTFTDQLKIYFNSEEITVRHFPGGHTVSDAAVYFKNADVIHIGDMAVMGQFPSVDYDNGGNAEQLAANLQEIISEAGQETKIITGHLDDTDRQGLIEYRNMLLATIDIVQQELKNGTDLKEMQEKDILKEWKSWGKHLTSDMWIKTIYECVKQKVSE